MKADVPKFEDKAKTTFDLGKTDTVMGETSNQVQFLHPSKGVKILEQDVKVARQMEAKKSKSRLKREKT